MTKVVCLAGPATQCVTATLFPLHNLVFQVNGRLAGLRGIVSVRATFSILLAGGELRPGDLDHLVQQEEMENGFKM